MSIPDDSPAIQINAPFGMAELTQALGRCKGKSEGIDEVGYPMLSHLPPIGKRKLLDLFNAEWSNRTLPGDWRHSLVMPIPKKEMGNGSPSNFRPISLTCCVSKIMERMVNRRLIQWMNERNLLDHRQHAFQPGRGVGTYFTDLGEILHEGLELGHVEIAALDLAKAYNRAWTPGVVSKLIQWGLGGNIVHFIRNFLRDRTFEVCIGNHRSSRRKEETGVPQGSVISVTIFLIAMNDVFTRLPKNMYCLAYADDIVLIATGRTQPIIRRRIQAAVTAVTLWAKRTGFEISAPKCELLHICRNRHNPLNTPVMADGHRIPSKRSMRVLGVYLDRHLTFIKHFAETKNSCRTRLNLLKTISRRHRMCNRRTLLQVAEAIIDSRLLFGVELLCMEADRMIDSLAPTYNRAIRVVSGLLPCTPADVACTEAGILPFRHKVVIATNNRATSHIERTHSTTADPQEETNLQRKATQLLRKYSNQILPPVAEIHWTGIRGWDCTPIKVDHSIQKKFRAGSNTAELKSTLTRILTTKFAGHTIRYSDGSKANGTVGIGVAGDITISEQLPNAYSVFSAEAAAAYYAVSRPSPGPRLIITDSASVIAAIQTDTSRHPWIQAIQSLADDTTFMWVPGHCGIRGNEKADQLANLGRSAPIRNSTVPGPDIRTLISKVIKESWAHEWNSSRYHLRRIKNVTMK